MNLFIKFIQLIQHELFEQFITTKRVISNKYIYFFLTLIEFSTEKVI